MLQKWQVLFIVLCFAQVLQSNSKNETSSRITIRQAESASSCSKGWYTFENMCYKLGGWNKVRRLPMDQAAEACRKDYNGVLATVYSKELNDFITAFFLLSVKENIWIGLHDRINESDYVWDDGTPVTSESFFNWEPTEPSGPANDKEDCVELVIRSSKPTGKTGHWNDISCDRSKLFLCQKEKGKFNKDYIDPRFCPSEVGGGWKKNASCFHIIGEEKTWSDAEEYCIQNFRGHLATITDFMINLYLNYILEIKKMKMMWIGIRIKKEYQQQWSSGWYVSYENWAEGEKPEEFGERLCVARNHEGKWVTHYCNLKLSFICEYSADTPPILKPKIEGSSCPSNPVAWRDLGGDYCYYFQKTDYVNWYEANFLCMRRGGTLLSIHSPEESLILQNFVRHYFMEFQGIFIGLYRRVQLNEEFVWADGSLKNYENWEVYEPNAELEQCGELSSYNFKWNDIDCKQIRGYICSVLKVSPNKTCENHENKTSVHSTLYLYYPSTIALVGIVICVLIASVGITVIVFYFCFKRRIKGNSASKLQLHYKRNCFRTENGIGGDGMYADII